MTSSPLGRDGGQDSALIFDTGDEVLSTLTDFVRRRQIRAAHFTAIGAFQEATLAYFDWETKRYRDIPVDEQVEVLALAGDVAWHRNDPAVHIHAVVGRRDGTTRGGHLRRAIVRPTLELMLTTGGALERRFNPAAGLALIAPGRPAGP